MTPFHHPVEVKYSKVPMASCSKDFSPGKREK